MKTELTSFLKALYAERNKLDKMITLAESMKEINDPEPTVQPKRKSKKVNGVARTRKGTTMDTVLPYLAEHGETQLGELADKLKLNSQSLSQALLNEQKRAESRVEKGSGRGSYQLTSAGAAYVIEQRKKAKADEPSTRTVTASDGTEVILPEPDFDVVGKEA